MRTVFWCCAGAMVLAATGVYLAADHAARNPCGYWGRCVEAAATVGAQCNPFFAAERFVSERCALGGPAAGAAMGMMIDKPVRAQGDAEAAEAHEPVIIECQQPLHCEAIRIELFPCDPDGAQGRGIEVAQAEFPLAMELLPLDKPAKPLMFEECEPAQEVIPAMPEAEEICPAPCAEGCRPRCCAWFWKMLQVAGVIRQAPCQPEMIPAPTSVDEEEAEEKNEQAEECNEGEGGVPCYRNNPHHSHHHGCPYMGCPYPHHRYTPPVPRPEEPAEEPTQPMPKKKKKVTWIINRSPVTCESLMQRLGGSEEESTVPEQGTIDTMEFRPTDDPRMPRGPIPF